MSRFWRQNVNAIEPYVPGEQPQDKQYIKLNTNENPYPPSPKVQKAMAEAVDERLRLYPDPNCWELIDAIGDYYGLKREQVFVGNGSDEVLAFAFLAFFEPGETILYPDITYSFYPVYSKLFEVQYDLQPLSDDFSVKPEAYSQDNGGVILANPNAPTGKVLPLSEIEHVLKANPDHVVLIDEAYIDFGGESAVSLIGRYDNLLVVQTMSKSRSLAGMRIGFAMGQPELIDGLNRIKNSINSYTMDRLALVAGAQAMKDVDYFNETREQIIRTRTWVTERLRGLGFEIPESGANFVFAAPSAMDAEDLFLKLKDKGILVRYFNKPRINGYLRISIGTDEEMTKLCDTIERLVDPA